MVYSMALCSFLIRAQTSFQMSSPIKYFGTADSQMQVNHAGEVAVGWVGVWDSCTSGCPLFTCFYRRAGYIHARTISTQMKACLACIWHGMEWIYTCPLQ